MQSHTLGAICLGTTRKLLGGYAFLPFKIGECISLNQLYANPMPNSVIVTAHTMAEWKKQPEGLIFTDQNNNMIPNKIPANHLPLANATGVGSEAPGAYNTKLTAVDGLQISNRSITKTKYKNLDWV